MLLDRCTLYCTLLLPALCAGSFGEKTFVVRDGKDATHHLHASQVGSGAVGSARTPEALQELPARAVARPHIKFMMKKITDETVPAEPQPAEPFSPC